MDSWFLDEILVNRPAGRFDGLKFATAIARRILRERTSYDVVNIHAPHGCVYGTWKKLFRPPGAPPYVMTMQGSEERYVVAMRREDRKGRASHFSWKNRVWHRLYHQGMFDYSIKTADGGAVANREAWSCAELKFGRGPGQIRYVPNGVEERFFVERKYVANSPVRLLYVGTWLDRKGVYYLAEAFNSIARNVPGVSLTVAGSQISAEQVKSCFTPERREQIRVIPRLSREEISDVYASHDIFVFPSLMEGMPLTLLEAMATGMPVVVTEIPGMAEIVEDEFNGLLVQPTDAAGLALAVERVCNSAELRNQLGRAAQTTMRRYRWEMVTRKLEHILFLAVQSEGRD